MARLGALHVVPPRTCVSAGRAEAQRGLNRESDCFSVGQILVKCLVARRSAEDLVVARGGLVLGAGRSAARSPSPAIPAASPCWELQLLQVNQVMPA